jgi:decaprenylphospho-beta-D-ribofuranose 2-oxidase
MRMILRFANLGERAGKIVKLAGWGKFPVIDSEVIEFSELSELADKLQGVDRAIARGMGRSYGDAALSNGVVISTTRYNRFISFDENSGHLRCQSGLTIAEILEILAPRGWFVKVSPGTKFVSIGGAIASNIHGKNHHKVGAFECGVESFDLLLASGEIVECSRDSNPELFAATCGGMGLTGVIGEVVLQLEKIPSTYAHQRVVKCRGLEEAMKTFEDNVESTHSVGWIDCLASGKDLGRTVVFLGEMATPQQVLQYTGSSKPHEIKKKLKLAIPFDFPQIALNRFSMWMFNELYYHMPRKAESVVDLDSYNYPLDSVHGWNKLYGKAGFFQYQSVLPLESSYEGYKEILEQTSQFGVASFLAVLKLFGEESSYLSFPKKGYTLTMDFPVRPETLALASRLDEIVEKHGGRLYLTKDARMSAESFGRMQSNELEKFKSLKHTIDENNKFSSIQSERLRINK